MKNLYNLLFKKNDAIVINKLAKKVDKHYKETKQPRIVGAMVKLKKNYQVDKIGLNVKENRLKITIEEAKLNRHGWFEL